MDGNLLSEKRGFENLRNKAREKESFSKFLLRIQSHLNKIEEYVYFCLLATNWILFAFLFNFANFLGWFCFADDTTTM